MPTSRIAFIGPPPKTYLCRIHPKIPFPCQEHSGSNPWGWEPLRGKEAEFGLPTLQEETGTRKGFVQDRRDNRESNGGMNSETLCPRTEAAAQAQGGCKQCQATTYN
ncbi:hypothetical protein P7K49_033707 [Saguinus oedipus]|uniref:Uncharacterized protein n=1 Tax=Saguinus oedipus TaxID=9490 RepID=A0ABQ9TSN6_SAGOE|nr:hypothetical protein P7K49_033707 [Saguinus oedipus]